MASTVDELRLEALGEHLLTIVSAKLTTADLARMRAVSRAWQRVVDNVEVRKAAFRATWGLAQLHGEPVNANFYLAAGLGHFAAKVQLGPRTSLATLLVRFRTDSTALRVLNNCASDFSLSCRKYVYVNVSSRSQLAGRAVAFTFDPLCRRQLAVLADCDPSAGSRDASAAGAAEGGLGTLARGHTGGRGPGLTACEPDGGAAADGGQREALLKKLCHQMGRGLGIDEGTAAYYLDLTDGDMRRAFLLYKEDRDWEAANPVGLLPLREPAA